jgi:sulfite exporter TauE/SafE/copper chaperone CopZ
MKAGDLETTRLKVDGMHCAHCEAFVERQCQSIPGVADAIADQGSGSLEIRHAGPLDTDALQRAVAEGGYRILAGENSSFSKTALRNYAEAAAALLVVVALFFALKRLDFLPDSIPVPTTISTSLALLIGLVASISTCMAVTGGLLLAVAAKYRDINPGLTTAQRLRPHLYFNAGRLASYTVLGAATGALGSALLLSQEVNGIIIVAVSTVMVVLGLQMLRLVPGLRVLPSTVSRRIADAVHRHAGTDAKGGAFLLGASTFFLPCGFTQALLLYVLAQGSAQTGALVMLAFAIGTVPALASLAALSSLGRAAFQRGFLKVAGVAVVALGLFNIQNGLTLTGYPIFQDARPLGQADAKIAPIVDGRQIAEMKIIEYGYEPYQFVVKQGIPVHWLIDAHDAAGCGLILIARKIAVRKILSQQATNIISFVPREPGEIAFNCGMGMMTPGAKFIVVPNVSG